LILVLVFGSIALYLYTRIQQTEQKVSLLESIVLDLKLTGELPAFGEFPSSSSLTHSVFAPAPAPAAPAPAPAPAPASPMVQPLVPASSAEEAPVYAPFQEETVVGESEPDAGWPCDVNEGHLPLEETIAIHPLPEETPYDSMTLKELQGVVRARSLPSEKGAKKQALIELLKRYDLSTEVKPASPRSSSSLETPPPLSEDVE
jgi:hypothetical protein